MTHCVRCHHRCATDRARRRQEYSNLFLHLRGLDVDLALRRLLYHFKLPKVCPSPLLLCLVVFAVCLADLMSVCWLARSTLFWLFVVLMFLFWCFFFFHLTAFVSLYAGVTTDRTRDTRVLGGVSVDSQPPQAIRLQVAGVCA